jgi:hypothetical protein
MKILMLGVEITAKRVGTWDQFARMGAWEVGSTVRLSESVHHFFDYPSKIKRRTAQISWQTVFNLFKANGRRFATDIEEARNCTELRGVSEDDPGRVKPKNFDGEPGWRHCWTHRGGLGP